LQDGNTAFLVRDPSSDGLCSTVARIARSEVTVLIRGETGVGKDVLARALHQRSGRTGPLLSVNCAALSETLLESELFGYERGAFTGAVQAKAGLFEAAAGGTIFLDEIGDAPASVQAKLLRAIETRQVLRVGGVRSIDVDVRFLAATHRDLRADAARGRFRHDLYFRLNGITLLVPPLRERPDAIRSLADRFVADASERTRRPRLRLSTAALARLARHDWPGNVRELKAVIERAVLLADHDAIESHHILVDAPVDASVGAPASRGESGPARERLVAALDQCAGNQTKAARLLGVSRSTLVRQLLVHGVPRPRCG
jgi:two-component system, NtrC family, response regulator AtoC